MLKYILNIIVITFFTLPVFADDLKPNEMHPPIKVLDANGNDAFAKNTKPAPEKTCNNCHDVKSIKKGCNHNRAKAQTSCFDCHVSDITKWTVESKRDDGTLDPLITGIKAADSNSCKKCHGIVKETSSHTEIPDDFAKIKSLQYKHERYSSTLNTGTIYSDEPISKSLLNITGKENISFSFDVHAKRMVDCTDCHGSKNNPSINKIETSKKLKHLKRDPRSLSVSEYLYRPNHDLVSPKCQSCHEPSHSHDFLPQLERHMKTLECQSCHVPIVYGPAASFIDATLVNSKGEYVTEYRNTQKKYGNLNTREITGFVPFLLSGMKNNDSKIGPYNIVTRWFWIGSNNKPVPPEILQKAIMNDSKHIDGLVKLLDKNSNKKLEHKELYLETEKQVEYVANLLIEQGIKLPTIKGVTKAVPIVHGVKEGTGARKECMDCHSKENALQETIILASRVPGKVIPTKDTSLNELSVGTLELNSSNNLIIKNRSTKTRRYVFGNSMVPWSDYSGFAIFILTVLALLAHGGYRFYTRKQQNIASLKTKKVYMYTVYERIWHWLMASSVIALLITGLKIHYPDTLALLGFQSSIAIHNFAAFILISNGFLSLFFHLATTAIKQFIPNKKSLIKDVILQIQYYTNGIFLGRPHPTHKSIERKLNPLQQLVYLGLLNVLFPFQIITGLAIWGLPKWPETLESIGGLSIIAPLHNIGSWLFLTFLVVHIYLTTTGHTIFSNIKAMSSGYDEIEIPNENVDGGLK